MNDDYEVAEINEPASMPDVGVSREQAVPMAKRDLNFFAALCVPEIFRFLYPKEFIAIWQMLTTASMKPVGKSRLAIGIPRGFAKTLLLKLLVVWMITFTNRRFFLVVCNTAEHAENFIADVVDILSSVNYIRLFGDWRIAQTKDTLGLKKFSFKGRDIILAGLGAGTSLRGLNIKLRRPDVIIMDDMQSKEEAESPVEANRSLSWMIGTLMKANDNNRCLHIFVGNMYAAEGSILRKLKHNPAWVSFITGAILEDGTSLWPELRSIEDLLEELENDTSLGHPEIFFAEVMNDEMAGSRSGIDFSKINVWIDDPSYPIEHQAGFVIIDPALAKRKSNDTAIGAVLIYDGEPVLRELTTGKLNEAQKINEMIRLALHYNLPALVVESVAYQASLCFWIERRFQQLNLRTLRVLEISPDGEQKNARIIEGLKKLTAQRDRAWIHPSVRAAVTHQITYFDPLRINNVDDILDLIAYMYRVIAKHQHQLLRAFEQLEEPVTATFTDDLINELDF